MEAYQQRVTEEKCQLDERLEKLLAFIKGDKFKDIDMIEQMLLKRQADAMWNYSHTLGERIKRFVQPRSSPHMSSAGTMNAPFITEDWLRDCGFKWEQHDRQPSKHWLLWIGGACLDYTRTTMHDNLGIELSMADLPVEEYKGLWYCWIRSDVAGRYARIIHVRHIYLQSEVETLISALTGRKVDWQDSMYGMLHNPVAGEHLREERNRLDQRINHAWVERVDRDKGVEGIDKDKRGVTLP